MINSSTKYLIYRLKRDQFFYQMFDFCENCNLHYSYHTTLVGCKWLIYLICRKEMQTCKLTLITDFNNFYRFEKWEFIACSNGRFELGVHEWDWVNERLFMPEGIKNVHALNPIHEPRLYISFWWPIQGLDFVPSRENHIWFSPDSFARINWFSFYDKIHNTAESNCYAN